MNFSPYHSFSACRRLENRIDILRSNGCVPDALYQAYEKYHFSLLHKMRSARDHVDSLSTYLSTGGAQAASPEELVYRVNFHFDGFLHVVGSATDIFAREILTYFNIAFPHRVYYTTAHTEIAANRPGDPIVARLVSPAWKQEFSDYRNTATHESLIGTQYTVVFEVRGNTNTSRVVFPIPDNPRAAQFTYRRNTDIVRYCCSTFRQVISLFNQAYTEVESRMRASGTLPL